jgi:hypothetical protein
VWLAFGWPHALFALARARLHKEENLPGLAGLFPRRRRKTSNNVSASTRLALNRIALVGLEISSGRKEPAARSRPMDQARSASHRGDQAGELVRNAEDFTSQLSLRILQHDPLRPSSHPDEHTHTDGYAQHQCDTTHRLFVVPIPHTSSPPDVQFERRMLMESADTRRLKPA